MPPPYYGPGETPPEMPTWAQPPADGPAAAPPYGTPPAPYGAPQGSPPGYGAPQGYPPAYGPPPGYAWAPNPTPASMIVLVVLAGIATTTCYFTLAGLPAVILGARALSLNGRDPEQARRLARIGWIVLGSVSAFIVVVIAVFIGVAVSQAP